MILSARTTRAATVLGRLIGSSSQQDGKRLRLGPGDAEAGELAPLAEEYEFAVRFE
jgi:hypothetical protein